MCCVPRINARFVHHISSCMSYITTPHGGNTAVLCTNILVVLDTVILFVICDAILVVTCTVILYAICTTIMSVVCAVMLVVLCVVIVYSPLTPQL